jgi:hypothetical protein
MTELLEKAFRQAGKLPEEDQDALAGILLADLASEERWTEAFARSQDKLALLAREALTEFEEADLLLCDGLARRHLIARLGLKDLGPGGSCRLDEVLDALAGRLHGCLQATGHGGQLLI